MIDIRTNTQKRRGWWVEARATVPTAVSKDGLIVTFRRSDVEATLDSHYTWDVFQRGARDKVWYFNSTRDRECAEMDGDIIYANPQVLFVHFMPIANGGW